MRRTSVKVGAWIIIAVATAMALSAVVPSVATAAVPTVPAPDRTVDTALAELHHLRLKQLAHYPSGRVVSPTADSTTNFGYRTYDDYNAEMQELADQHPGLVAIKTAPYRSVEGRAVRYLEITNDVYAHDGKPVFFLMGLVRESTAAGRAG